MKEIISRELCAKVIDVVSCTHQSGYVRDYKTESRLREDIMDERLFDGSGIHCPDYWKDRYEERLYMHSNLDSYVKEDETTREPILMSYRKWYDYKLRISYVLEGCTINIEVPYSSDYEDIHVGDNFYVMVNNLNPEKVLSISTQSEKDRDVNILLKFLLVGMIVFLVLLFVLAKIVIYV